MQYRPKLDEMERRYEELTAQMADANKVAMPMQGGAPGAVIG